MISKDSSYHSRFGPETTVTFFDSDERDVNDLDLSYLINPTPVRVSPMQPLETVMTLFKQMGYVFFPVRSLLRFWFW